MLLAEMVRQIKNEQNLIYDATNYSIAIQKTTWTLLKDYGNITLSTAGIVAWRFSVGSGYSAHCLRLKIGNYYVWGKNGTDTGQPVTGWFGGYAYLPAGTHNVRLEYYNNSSVAGGVSNFELGFLAFTDTVGYGLTQFSTSFNLTVSNRNTPLGPLNQAVAFVICWAYTSGAVTNFENPGESLTNGVNVWVDGVQKPWTVRNQDTTPVGNASAILAIPLSVGSSHTFNITVDNANTVVHISALFSPWILGSDLTQPINLTFPQQSTFYAVFEPCALGTTAYSYIGKRRALSFGASTDYYSTASGSGILTHSYTFEAVDISNIIWVAYGLYTCISTIGVDVR